MVLQGHMANKGYYIYMANKGYYIYTATDSLWSPSSVDMKLWPRGLARSHDKLKPLYLQYHNGYG